MRGSHERLQGLCAVCRRGARGFGWFDARFGLGDPRRVESLRWFCSLTCQDICHRRRGMIDPTRHERAAMDHAVAMAGEHIESLGRTDLMTWSPEEFASAHRGDRHRVHRSPARARRRSGGGAVSMSESYMARLGARLVDNGYPVLPIMPGTKKPGQFKRGAWRDYPGWTKHGARPTSEHELIVWSGWPDAGIGIPTGTVIGVDIDIRDDEAREPAGAAGARDARRHAGGPVRPAAQAPAGLPRGRAALRHEGAPDRGARARPAVRRLRRPPGDQAPVRVAAGVAGRSAGRDACRWSTRP